MASIPFAGVQYVPHRGGDNITRLLMEKGRISGEGSLRQGDIWANTVGQLGQQAVGAIEQHQMAKRDAAWVSYVQSGEWQKDPKQAFLTAQRIWGPKEGVNQFQALQAASTIGQGKPEESLKKLGLVIGAAEKMEDPARAALWPQLRALGLAALPEVQIPEQYDPQFWSTMVSPLGAQIRGDKPQEGFTLSPGQQRFGADGKPIANVPAEAPKPPNLQHVETAQGIQSFNPQTGELGPVIAQGRPNAQPATEPLEAVIGDDGQPVYLPRSQAVGRRPAGTREQGRPVTSGDAGRVADLDTSLDDLATLSGALSGSKATGTTAKAGAMLPNFVTEATGLGAEAKSKQAVIDRVKQVIGKALEGGVLRKEDEYKYEKILPTIGDVPSVVKAKLDGLGKAIRQRRQTFLDSLSDAGYDTSKYSARQPKLPDLTPGDDALLKKYGY